MNFGYTSELTEFALCSSEAFSLFVLFVIENAPFGSHTFWTLEENKMQYQMEASSLQHGNHLTISLRIGMSVP